MPVTLHLTHTSIPTGSTIQGTGQLPQSLQNQKRERRRNMPSLQARSSIHNNPIKRNCYSSDEEHAGAIKPKKNAMGQPITDDLFEPLWGFLGALTRGCGAQTDFQKRSNEHISLSDGFEITSSAETFDFARHHHIAADGVQEWCF